MHHGHVASEGQLCVPDPVWEPRPALVTCSADPCPEGSSPMAHLVKEGELLQGAVLAHSSDGQVFGTTEFHFLLW